MDIVLNVIIGFGIFTGILLFNKTKPIFLKVLLAGLIISLIFNFFIEKIKISSPFFVFGIFSLIYSVYSICTRKWANSIIGLFAFVSIFNILFDLPYYGAVQFLMLIPIVFFVFKWIYWKDNISQLSILSVLGFYELVLFLKFIEALIET